MTFRVLKAGLSTTVQDGGRFGYAHLGVSPCGAADTVSLRIANLLVGNLEYAPALEMTLLGATLEFERNTNIAIAGASCKCKVGQYRIPAHTAVEIPAGGILQCGSMTGGARAYLAIQGGVDVPLVMGSASTDLRGGFGGFEGRRLREGDIFRDGGRCGSRPRRLRAGALDGPSRSGPIRVTRGAQSEWFSTGEYTKFMAAPFTVSEQSDRAGLRLMGEPVRPVDDRQLLTDGIPLGAVQVPQDGQPILLFVDQQTTGGYPKIANVIGADMHRVGQLRPRDEVRFNEVSIHEAIDALRALERWLQEIWQDL